MNGNQRFCNWEISVCGRRMACSGKKNRLGIQDKDKKRAIVYLSPKDGWFIVTFVFGQKATAEIMASEINADIKTELMNSKVYMEGRVVRIEIREPDLITDIKKLVLIKPTN